MTPIQYGILKFQNGKNDWAIFLNPVEDIVVHNTNQTSYSEITYAYVLEDLGLASEMFP